MRTWQKGRFRPTLPASRGYSIGRFFRDVRIIGISGKRDYCFKISTTKRICKLLMISLADVATARVMSRCSKSPPADSPLLQHWPDVETMERACGINWNNVFSCFFKWQTTRGCLIMLSWEQNRKMSPTTADHHDHPTSRLMEQ